MQFKLIKFENRDTVYFIEWNIQLQIIKQALLQYLANCWFHQCCIARAVCNQSVHFQSWFPLWVISLLVFGSNNSTHESPLVFCFKPRHSPSRTAKLQPSHFRFVIVLKTLNKVIRKESGEMNYFSYLQLDRNETSWHKNLYFFTLFQI